MEILTNINVSVFNIIRYIIITILIDIIVRNGLNTLEHFYRRLSLYRGRSVSLSAIRIDRYNVLRTPGSGHRMYSSLLLAIAIIAYSVEVGLEYAVDSLPIRYPSSGIITRAEYKTGVCSMERLVCDNLQYAISMAEQCVVFVDDTYRFYRPVWIREADGTFVLLCEQVPQNLQYEGEGVYGANFGSHGASEIAKLIETGSNNSRKSFGDPFYPLAIVNVTSNDVFQRSTFDTPASEFTTDSFITRLPGTDVRCIGFTLGRPLQDTVLLQFLGCVDSFGDDGSLVLTTGTSSVDVGTQVQVDGSLKWSTEVAFEVRKRIPHFFRGVLDWRSNAQANATAYAAFLSRAGSQDIINLNKYAILYRFCDQITVPVWNGTSWQEEFEFASSEVRVTATVEEWGIVLITCWVLVVTVPQLVVQWVAFRKGMPGKLYGEQYLIRRWAEENNPDESGKDAGEDAFLSVQEGLTVDHITATLRRRTLHRDKNKDIN